ncbi:unnamed protein product [Calypogeia fissa]
MLAQHKLHDEGGLYGKLQQSFGDFTELQTSKQGGNTRPQSLDTRKKKRRKPETADSKKESTLSSRDSVDDDIIVYRDCQECFGGVAEEFVDVLLTFCEGEGMKDVK